MKIISDSSALLDELQARLQNNGIVVSPTKVPSKKTDMGLWEDIVQLVLEYPDESQMVVEAIIDELTSLYRQEHIYVERNDGEQIPYVDYKLLTSEEKSEFIF